MERQIVSANALEYSDNKCIVELLLRPSPAQLSFVSLRRCSDRCSTYFTDEL